MSKKLAITWSILSSLLIIGLFVSSCVCVYHYNLHIAAYWWSWFAALWLVDIFVGGYIFYKHNCPDESKTFWLFMMVILPFIGGALAIIFNYKLRTEYGRINNDHTKLQNAIFQAKHTIKIYSNSFFTTYDTFKALNFARWKGVKIQLIISMQAKKSKQELLLFTLQRFLESKIELHLTDKEINSSFIIFDDQEVITVDKNFNFRNIYQSTTLKVDHHVTGYNRIWENDFIRTSSVSLEKGKINPWKKVKFKVINIFYPFF